jgi:hypothetical protein
MFLGHFRKEACGHIINDRSICMIKLRKMCWALHRARMEEEKGYRD